MANSGTHSKVYNLSVSKALSIINLLAENEEPLSLKQISESLSISPSTAHHIISAMKQERFIEQEQTTKKYGIGLRLYEIGLSKSYYQLLAKKAAPLLEIMSEQTGESSNLAVLIDGQITYIAQRQSSQLMKTFVQLGERSPVHCTGVGKILISDLSEDDIKLIIKNHGLKKFTPQTITNLKDLLAELEEVKRNHYALDHEEREEGVFCIAAPVYNSSRKVIAAISISGPTVRLKEEGMKEIVTLLKVNAQLLSDSL
jgi:DNA-binding IclR family transcriptional regulator